MSAGRSLTERFSEQELRCISNVCQAIGLEGKGNISVKQKLALSKFFYSIPLGQRGDSTSISDHIWIAKRSLDVLDRSEFGQNLHFTSFDNIIKDLKSLERQAAELSSRLQRVLPK